MEWYHSNSGPGLNGTHVGPGRRGDPASGALHLTSGRPPVLDGNKASCLDISIRTRPQSFVLSLGAGQPGANLDASVPPLRTKTTPAAVSVKTVMKMPHHPEDGSTRRTAAAPELAIETTSVSTTASVTAPAATSGPSPAPAPSIVAGPSPVQASTITATTIATAATDRATAAACVATATARHTPTAPPELLTFAWVTTRVKCRAPNPGVSLLSLMLSQERRTAAPTRRNNSPTSSAMSGPTLVDSSDEEDDEWEDEEDVKYVEELEEGEFCADHCRGE